MHKTCVLKIAAAAAAFACATARAQVATTLHTPDGPVPVRWESCDPAGSQVTLSKGTVSHPEGGAPVLVELTDLPGADRDAALEFDFPLTLNWQPVKAVRFWVRPEGALPSGALSVRIYAGGRTAARGKVEELKPGEWSPVTVAGKFRATWDFGLDQHRCKIQLKRLAETDPVTVRFHIDNVRLLEATAESRPEQLTQLKDLRLDTTLAQGGKPQAVLVVPAGEAYAKAVETVQAAVKRCVGITLPVRADGDLTTRELLGTSHAIVLGNMHSSEFVEKLYCEYYTMTDLWYPGKGGYEVRSLHDPYGTGHNVIFLGGSDEAGVQEAARVFAALLEPGDPLKVGWLMEIKLGEGLEPPGVKDRIHAWSDSWRPGGGKKGTGYGSASTFGWNGISVAAALYYMTGRKEWLDKFRSRALPEPEEGSEADKKKRASQYGEKSARNPLASASHYTTHLTTLWWDLIEESPLLTDAERLRFTNHLLEHQNIFDPNDTYQAANGTRHGQWHMMCIYTGSRYFDKYYPHPRWQKRIANAQRSWRAFIGNPTWGEGDNKRWINTSTEIPINFCVLAGLDELVTSGTVREMMGALEMLWTGSPYEESNRCQSLGLLRKAAYLTKDGRYLWLADKARYDTSGFRIGQSFAPPPSLKPVPPTDRIGRVSVFRLQSSRWRGVKKYIPEGQGYQFLSYRSGLTTKDDFVLVDGYYGATRNSPYHVSALHRLRMGGKTLLSGYENQLFVRRQGMVELRPAKAAALEASACSGNAFYVRSRVPNMPFSDWSRHILYLNGLYTLVVDELRARSPGTFDMFCQWKPSGDPKVVDGAPRCVQARKKPATTIACSAPADISAGWGSVRQTWTRALEAEETCAMGNLIYPAERRGTLDYRLEQLDERTYFVTGKHDALVSVGACDKGTFDIAAEAAYCSGSRLFVADARRFACDETVLIEASEPATLSWDLGAGTVEVDASRPVRIRLAVQEPKAVTIANGEWLAVAGSLSVKLDLPAGRHELANCRPSEEAVRRLTAALAELRPAEKTEPAAAETGRPDSQAGSVWNPAWTLNVTGALSHVAFSPYAGGGTVWAAGKKSLVAVDPAGDLKHRQELSSPALSLWAASSPAQANAFGVLVGCDDDQLHAIDADGMPQWTVTAELSKFWIKDNGYKGRWWHDPKNNHGIKSLLVGDLWGTGAEEIALGRAGTVELRDLAGKLLKRQEVLWGENTTLAHLPVRKESQEPLLLAGQFWTGLPDITVINKDREAASHEGYRWDMPRGVVRMTAWMQQGTSHMAAEDLDGDGSDEVVILRSGHWNELNVYDRRGNCRWMKYFGPAAPKSRFMRALLVTDLDGEGTKEVIVSMENGWVCAFGADGAPLWQRKFDSPVAALAAVGPWLAVGERAGRVSLLSALGYPVRTADLQGGVSALRAVPAGAGGQDMLVAAGRAGTLAGFAVPARR